MNEESVTSLRLSKDIALAPVERIQARSDTHGNGESWLHLGAPPSFARTKKKKITNSARMREPPHPALTLVTRNRCHRNGSHGQHPAHNLFKLHDDPHSISTLTWPLLRFCPCRGLHMLYMSLLHLWVVYVPSCVSAQGATLVVFHHGQGYSVHQVNYRDWLYL